MQRLQDDGVLAGALDREGDPLFPRGHRAVRGGPARSVLLARRRGDLLGFAVDEEVLAARILVDIGAGADSERDGVADAVAGGPGPARLAGAPGTGRRGRGVGSRRGRLASDPARRRRGGGLSGLAGLGGAGRAGDRRLRGVPGARRTQGEHDGSQRGDHREGGDQRGTATTEQRGMTEPRGAKWRRELVRRVDDNRLTVRVLARALALVLAVVPVLLLVLLHAPSGARRMG